MTALHSGGRYLTSLDRSTSKQHTLLCLDAQPAPHTCPCASQTLTFWLSCLVCLSCAGGCVKLANGHNCRVVQPMGDRPIKLAT
jgi:hypothetical protein